MANLLRMDFYRLIKGKMVWIFLGIIVVVAIFEAGFLAYLSSDAGKALMSNAMSASLTASGGLASAGLDESDIALLASGDLFGSTQLQYVAKMFLSGNVLTLLLCLLTALFTAVEFESGFAKNIFSTRRNKVSYFASKLIVMLVITVVFLLFATLIALLTLVVIGASQDPSSLTEWLSWFALSTLILFAYELIVAAVVWLFRNKVAAVVMALLLTTGFIGTILSALLGFVFPDMPAINVLLYTSLTAVGTGTAGIESLGIAVILVTGFIYAIVSGGVGMISLKKKDV